MVRFGITLPKWVDMPLNSSINQSNPGHSDSSDEIIKGPMTHIFDLENIHASSSSHILCRGEWERFGDGAQWDTAIVNYL